MLWGKQAIQFISCRKDEMLSLDSEFAFSASKENERLIRRKVKVDSKGRISIPSDIRKNFRLDEGIEIDMLLDLKKNYVILDFRNGQDSVCSNTGDCGSSESGARDFDTDKKLCHSAFPDSGPQIKGGDLYGR